MSGKINVVSGNRAKGKMLQLITTVSLGHEVCSGRSEFYRQELCKSFRQAIKIALQV
jgi:hypothetical protein